MLGRWGDLAVGVGDDTATIDVPPGERVVVSTDTSVEGIHFRRNWLTIPEIARRATTAALSDLAAAAATPRAVVLSLALPDDLRGSVEGIADGIAEAVRATGAGFRVVGGDITRSPHLVLGVTVIGSAREPLGRRGAHPGDSLYLTGVLGGPAEALAAWGRGDEPSPWARDRFVVPKARLAEGRWLRERGGVAAIDVSDGLASELGHLAAASGCELRIDVASVPRPEGMDWRRAVASGEEYELLVVVRGQVDVDAFARAFGVPLTRIGVVRASDAARVVATENGERVDLPAGHDHFSR
jgi:thiamine-monophosphate kinase